MKKNIKTKVFCKKNKKNGVFYKKSLFLASWLYLFEIKNKLL